MHISSQCSAWHSDSPTDFESKPLITANPFSQRRASLRTKCGTLYRTISGLYQTASSFYWSQMAKSQLPNPQHITRTQHTTALNRHATVATRSIGYTNEHRRGRRAQRTRRAQRDTRACLATSQDGRGISHHSHSLIGQHEYFNPVSFSLVNRAKRISVHALTSV